MTALICLLALSVVPSPPVDASATRRGLVNTSAQSFAGLKTFVDGGVRVNGDVVVDGGLWVSGVLAVDGGITVSGQQVVTATTGTTTLYVDTAGSDSNACTSSGASACLTINGALGKLPPFLRNSATVNIAAGTYASTVLVDGFKFSGSASLTLQGAALAASTLTTGANSGTITTFTAYSHTVNLAAIADTGQSWTTNDLVGRFLQVTSGAASGQYRTIVSNTATSMELAGTFTSAPSAGATYAIVQPASIITGAVTIGGSNSPPSNPDLTAILFSAVDVSVATGTALSHFAPVRTQLTNSRATTAGASNSAVATASSRSVVLANAYVYGLGSGIVLNGCQPGSFLGSTGIAGSLVKSGGPAFQASFCSGGGQILGMVFETTSSTGNVIGLLNTTFMPTSNQSALSPWIRCPSGSTGAGIYSGIKISDPSEGGVVNFGMQGNVTIENCGRGIWLKNPSATWLTQPFGTLAFRNTTTAFSLDNAASAYLAARTPTFSGVTNEITLDGTTYTYANLTAASPQVLVGGLGSRIIR